MSDNYVITPLGEIEKNPFRWRTQKGEFIPLHRMDTSHMFNTVVMIWNHAVPYMFRLKPYTHYTFCDFYTPKYMGLALETFLVELKKRRDLTDEQCVRLEKLCAMARELKQSRSLPLF